MQLGIEFLGRRYSTDMIHYYDIEIDYRPFPQMTHNDYAWMDRAFLLYILGAYLFANGGQAMSWWWLSLFFFFFLKGFERPTRAKHALLTCSLPWTHSVEGLCASWWGLCVDTRGRFGVAI